MIRTQTHILLALLACGLVLPIAPAQSADLAQQLAPCLSSDTLMVVKIDVARLDVKALARMALDTAQSTMTAEQIAQFKDTLDQHSPLWQQQVNEFKKAGGESLFVIVNPGHFLLVVPRTSRFNESAIKAWLSDLTESSMAGIRRGELFVAAPAWMLDLLKDQTPTVRPELIQAATHATNATIELFLIPSADSRLVLEAMLPAMTGPNITLQTGALVNGLQWATIGIELPPSPQVKAYVASATPPAATALRDFVGQTLTALGQHPILKNAYPNIQAPIALLTPRVDGSTLKLALDEKQSQQLAAQFLTPGLFEVHKSILRVQCQQTLNGMGKAMLIYANDYEDKWPPSLETLVKTVEYSRSGLTCPAMRHKPDYESYVFRGVDTPGMAVEPMIILVHDRAGNHADGRNVLFVDSHIEWVTEEQFQELIARDNEIRAKRGLPQKPAP